MVPFLILSIIIRYKKSILVCEANTLYFSLLLDSALDSMCHNPAAQANWNDSSLRLLTKDSFLPFLTSFLWPVT